MTHEEALKFLEAFEILTSTTFSVRADAYTTKVVKALLIATESLERQIPKKPLFKKSQYYFTCPVCGAEIKRWDEYFYCKKCGTRIDWSDEND